MDILEEDFQHAILQSQCRSLCPRCGATILHGDGSSYQLNLAAACFKSERNSKKFGPHASFLWVWRSGLRGLAGSFVDRLSDGSPSPNETNMWTFAIFSLQNIQDHEKRRGPLLFRISRALVQAEPTLDCSDVHQQPAPRHDMYEERSFR